MATKIWLNYVKIKPHLLHFAKYKVEFILINLITVRISSWKPILTMLNKG